VPRWKIAVWSASTIDRRVSTVCGFYRFAHIDGRIGSNPAQYVRRPQVHPSDARGLDRSEFGVFLFTAEQYDREHAALAVLLGLNGSRVSEACATNIENLGIERGHRTLRILARGTSPRRSRWLPAPPTRSISMSGNATRVRSCADATDSGSTGARRTGGCVRSASAPGSGTCTRTCCAPRSSWPPSTPAYPCGTCRPPRRHSDPRTTTIYDRRRQNFDRHAAYVVVAFVAFVAGG
jgi:integrase